jgi:hypothetical protein
MRTTSIARVRLKAFGEHADIPISAYLLDR